jgi:hypothetical protein
MRCVEGSMRTDEGKIEIPQPGMLSLPFNWPIINIRDNKRANCFIIIQYGSFLNNRSKEKNNDFSKISFLPGK